MASNYSSTAINQINSLYYSSSKAFTDHGLANFFTSLSDIQIALAHLMMLRVDNEIICVKELGSGPSINKWIDIANEHRRKNWNVIATDFTRQALPQLGQQKIPSNLQMTSQVVDLRKEFQNLEGERKLDVMFSTYTFDSIWFSKDVHLERKDGEWYCADYCLEGSLSIQSIKELLKVKIRKRLRPVSKKELPELEIIKKYYTNGSQISINYPGGLINKVQEAFDKQMKNDGVFISADIAVNSKSGVAYTTSEKKDRITMKDYMVSGDAAIFKIEDYGLAKIVLERKGFMVEILTLKELMNQTLDIEFDCTDHLVLVVKKDGFSSKH